MIRSKMLWKLYAGYAILVLASTTLVALLIARQIERDALEEIRESLHVRALMARELVRHYLSEISSSALPDRVRELGVETQTRITVVRSDGRVLADSHQDPARMGDHSNRPEILAAAAEGYGAATRMSSTVGRRMMYMALALQQQGSTWGYVRTALPLADVDRRLRHLRGEVMVACGISLFVALVLGFVVARRLTRPLISMTAQVESLAEGRFEQGLATTARDEIGTLARAINRVARSSRQRLEALQADRNKLRTILAGMVEGVIAVDRSERLVHMNEAAFKILNTPPEEVSSRPLREIIRVREICETLSRVIGEETEMRAEVTLVGRRGDRHVSLHTAPLWDGDGQLGGAVCVMHDMTELRRLEKVRRDFVANVSHELKTPVTAIRGAVETLQEDPHLTEEEWKRFVGKIHSQCLRLSALLNDLLTLARMESDSVAPERRLCDLRRVLQSALQPLLAAADQGAVKIDVQLSATPVWVLGEQEALGQAAGNLIDNAIKYTPRGGLIYIRLGAQSGYATLEVQDTGLGIEPRHQARIFERFYRVDAARSRELGGTGLGLSIVRHVVLRHGGQVSVESAPGLGSTFRVVLPLAEAQDNSTLS